MKNKYLSFIVVILILMLSGCGGSSSSSSSGGFSSGVVSTSLVTSDLIAANDNADSKNAGCPAESCFYFSYDDSASTASVELVKYYLKNGLQPDRAWGRPFEFLNFEKFDRSSQQDIGLFNVAMGIWTHPDLSNATTTLYELGVHVSAPQITKEERPNLVLTLLIDVSGSMEDPYIPFTLDKESAIRTRLDVVKYGLSQLCNFSLKEGDIINIVQFSSDSTASDVLLEGWNYSNADNKCLGVGSSLRTIGSTNLNAGIERAYLVANRTFKADHTNRVVILTDAYANTGEVDPAKVSQPTRINNQEGIYFSGLGIGSGFNEAFLNQLTDAGKGAYFAAITPLDIEKAFLGRFIALLNVAAKDTLFRLDFPKNLTHITTAAEQISTDPNKVQSTNFSYNTSQFFLEGFKLGETAISDETIKLTIQYKDKDGVGMTETIEAQILDLIQKEGQIKDAFIITFLADLVSKKQTCATFDTAKTTILKGYTSPIAEVYYDLIAKFCALKVGQ